jgi:hypothetical protein
MHGSQSGNLARLRDRWVGRPGAAAVIAVVVLALVPILTGCSSGDTPEPAAAKPTNAQSSTATVQDVMELEDFAPLEPGTYFIDPDGDPSTPLRVVYEVPFKGWLNWIGTTNSSNGAHVMVSITTVTNLVRHGCRDHSWADPPVGPSVKDLTTALADLAPFRVTSPPKDVTIYGYSGKHLELTVPDLPVEGPVDDRSFAKCEEGHLKSWVAPVDTEPGDAFYGYNGEPGRTEEFWILDVDGTRLMIEANWSPASLREDVAEMRAILDSIRIEP